MELVPLGAVPLGMVSSTLLYGAGSSGEQTEASLYMCIDMNAALHPSLLQPLCVAIV